MSGNFLTGYAGFKAQPFLWMDFEGGSPQICKATGENFVATNGGDPDAIYFSSALSKWGSGCLYSNNLTTGDAGHRYASEDYIPEWDFLSNLNNYCIACWVKMHVYSTQTKYLWSLGCEAGDGNTLLACGVRQSGGNAVFTHSFPLSSTFIASISQSIALTTDWVFVVCARISGTGYISVNGAASPTGVAGGVGLAAPQDCGISICSGIINSLSASQLGGAVDHLHGYRAIPYNVISGFTVPTSAPTY